MRVVQDESLEKVGLYKNELQNGFIYRRIDSTLRDRLYLVLYCDKSMFGNSNQVLVDLYDNTVYPRSYIDVSARFVKVNAEIHVECNTISPEDYEE